MIICLSDQQGPIYGEVNVVEWGSNMLKGEKSTNINLDISF